MKREMTLLSIISLFVFSFIGCGKKYPMPSRSGEGIPPESSYVLVGSPWDAGGAQDLLRASDGRVYVLYPQKIEKRYTNGVPIDTFGVGILQDAKSLAEGPNRTIYVLDASISGIFMFSFQGEKTGEIHLEGVDDPTGIAYGSHGIYISEGSLNLILHYDTTGNFIDTLAREGNGILNVVDPKGIFYDALDRILVASTGHNWVEAFPPDTPLSSLLHLGGTSPEGGSDEGEFLSPLDVAVDFNGFVFVSDSGNMRVQKFSPDGSFIVEVDIKDGHPLRLDVEPYGNTYFVLIETSAGKKIEKYEKTPKPGGGG